MAIEAGMNTEGKKLYAETYNGYIDFVNNKKTLSQNIISNDVQRLWEHRDTLQQGLAMEMKMRAMKDTLDTGNIAGKVEGATAKANAYHVIIADAVNSERVSKKDQVDTWNANQQRASLQNAYMNVQKHKDDKFSPWLSASLTALAAAADSDALTDVVNSSTLIGKGSSTIGGGGNGS